MHYRYSSRHFMERKKQRENLTNYSTVLPQAKHNFSVPLFLFTVFHFYMLFNSCAMLQNKYYFCKFNSNKKKTRRTENFIQQLLYGFFYFSFSKCIFQHHYIYAFVGT